MKAQAACCPGAKTGRARVTWGRGVRHSYSEEPVSVQEREAEIRRRVHEVTGRTIYGVPAIWEDTTAFFRIGGGDVVRLAGRDYFVTGDATEGRFGIDDQPKYWVKYAVDLDTGTKKVLKLAFHEELEFRVGQRLFPGKRSAEKEARVLRKIRGHPHFMQGVSETDAAGNLVRVLDVVSGPSVYRLLRDLDLDHRSYLREVLPGVMVRLLEAFEAIDSLHGLGEHHGDIRNDHLIVDSNTGRYVWIDFDYEMTDPGYDIVCLGNILACVVGKGNHYFNEYRQPSGGAAAGGRGHDLTPDDALLFFRHRIANLRKLYPHIPETLGRLLLRFSVGGFSPYPSVRKLMDDVRDACVDL